MFGAGQFTERERDVDVVILGTGLTNCVLAAALSRVGKRVLHLDANHVYGGYWSSLSYKSLKDWAASLSDDHASSSSKTSRGGPLQSGRPDAFAFRYDVSYLPKAGDEDTSTPDESAEEGQHQPRIEEKQPSADEERADSGAGANEEDSKKEKNPSDAWARNAQSSIRLDYSAADDFRQVSFALDPWRSRPGTEEDSCTKVPWTGANVEDCSGPSDEAAAAPGRAERSDDLLERKSNAFSIDLIPRLMFAKSRFVSLAVESSVSRYLEFQGLKPPLTLWTPPKNSSGGGGNFLVVPTSKQLVFQDQQLTLLEKRSLMKFIQNVASEGAVSFQSAAQMGSDKSEVLRKRARDLLGTGDGAEVVSSEAPVVSSRAETVGASSSGVWVPTINNSVRETSLLTTPADERTTTTGSSSSAAGSSARSARTAAARARAGRGARGTTAGMINDPSKQANTGPSSSSNDQLPDWDCAPTNFLGYLALELCSERLRDYVLYGICLVQDRQEALELSVKQGLHRLHRFIQSLALFGRDQPFLYPMYGTADVGQAFTRLAALHETVYALQVSVAEVLMGGPSGRAQEQKKGKTSGTAGNGGGQAGKDERKTEKTSSEEAGRMEGAARLLGVRTTSGDLVRCKKLVVSPEYRCSDLIEERCSSTQGEEVFTLRLVIITTAPLLLPEGFGVCVALPLNNESSSETLSPVQILQLDASCGSTPDGYIILHFSQVFRLPKNSPQPQTLITAALDRLESLAKTMLRAGQPNEIPCLARTRFCHRTDTHFVSKVPNLFVSQNPGSALLLLDSDRPDSELEEAERLFRAILSDPDPTTTTDATAPFLPKPGYIATEEKREADANPDVFASKVDAAMEALEDGGKKNPRGGGESHSEKQLSPSDGVVGAEVESRVDGGNGGAESRGEEGGVISSPVGGDELEQDVVGKSADHVGEEASTDIGGSPSLEQEEGVE